MYTAKAKGHQHGKQNLCSYNACQQLYSSDCHGHQNKLILPILGPRIIHTETFFGLFSSLVMPIVFVVGYNIRKSGRDCVACILQLFRPDSTQTKEVHRSTSPPGNSTSDIVSTPPPQMTTFSAIFLSQSEHQDPKAFFLFSQFRSPDVIFVCSSFFLCCFSERTGEQLFVVANGVVWTAAIFGGQRQSSQRGPSLPNIFAAGHMPEPQQGRFQPCFWMFRLPFASF